MADIELVIKIPEEVYNYIKRLKLCNMAEEYIKKGVSLDELMKEKDEGMKTVGFDIGGRMVGVMGGDAIMAEAMKIAEPTPKMISVDVLDKIRDEIKKERDRDMGGNQLIIDGFHYGINLALEIINEYTKGDIYEIDNNKNINYVLYMIRHDINGIRYSHMFNYVDNERVLDTAIEIIDKYKNGTGRCDTCVNSDEVDGSNCYECIKGIQDKYTKGDGE